MSSEMRELSANISSFYPAICLTVYVLIKWETLQGTGCYV